MSGQPILLVEDHHLDIDLALETFKQAGIANKILVARDGEEAVDYLLKRGDHAARSEPDPCLIILDVSLPRMTGLELLEVIRSDSRTHHIPVIVLSGSNEVAQVVRSFKLGTNLYVQKPVRIRDLVDAVRDLGLSWDKDAASEGEIASAR